MVNQIHSYLFMLQKIVGKFISQSVLHESTMIKFDVIQLQIKIIHIPSEMISFKLISPIISW